MVEMKMTLKFLIKGMEVRKKAVTSSSEVENCFCRWQFQDGGGGFPCHAHIPFLFAETAMHDI